MLEELDNSEPIVTPTVEVVQQVEKKKSLHSVTKDFLLSKFNSKKGNNASTWITLFENECKRTNVEGTM